MNISNSSVERLLTNIGNLNTFQIKLMFAS